MPKKNSRENIPQTMMSQMDYFKQITQSKFTLSPPGLYHTIILYSIQYGNPSLKGNGEDCHRTWEAVLLGSIPIVRHSGIESLYQDAPILILGNGPQKEQIVRIKCYYINNSISMSCIFQMIGKPDTNHQRFFWIFKLQHSAKNMLWLSSG